MGEKVDLEDLIINGTAYKTILSEKFKNRKNWEAANPKLIEAYIPGTISKIFVTEGQKVKEGTKLLILEAMKMKNVVATPVAGIVKSINVEEGQMVPRRRIIIEIE